MELKFNEKTFTKNRINGNAVGYYKVFKKTIGLYNVNNEKIGVVTKNRVLAKATKTDNGYWYSYGNIEEIGNYESYIKECDDINRALEVVFN